MNVTVCIGSSCHIKGSRQLVEQLQYLIAEKSLGDQVELSGTFCMGKCQQGVCVTVDETFFSVTPENVDTFFEKNVLQSDFQRTGTENHSKENPEGKEVTGHVKLFDAKEIKL